VEPVLDVTADVNLLAYNVPITLKGASARSPVSMVITLSELSMVIKSPR
jgi:hypothetical protein